MLCLAISSTLVRGGLEQLLHWSWLSLSWRYTSWQQQADTCIPRSCSSQSGDLSLSWQCHEHEKVSWQGWRHSETSWRQQRHLLKAVTAAWRHYAAVGNFLHLCLQVSIVSQTVYRTSGFRFRLPAASVSLKAITGALGSYQPNLLPNFSRLLTFHKVRCGVAHHWITLDFHIWKTTKINVNY